VGGNAPYRMDIAISHQRISEEAVNHFLATFILYPSHFYPVSRLKISLWISLTAFEKLYELSIGFLLASRAAKYTFKKWGEVPLLLLKTQMKFRSYLSTLLKGTVAQDLLGFFFFS